ncbi:MAG: AMP-binding protein, partial [Acidimicrobiia bacterium]|nr:AMP-binding protein [Acidimicrobiia bacterium]
MQRAPGFGPVHQPDPVGLHTLLERTADRTPEGIALRFGPEQWSFRELDGLANAAARLLADHGVGPGVRVAMMASNRPE